MLGRYADRFMAKQRRERIVATQPNHRGNGPTFADRGDRGTGKGAMVTGHYEMPGPQRSISSMELAGVFSARGMMPGMAGAEMMPGMGAEMMPGMGAEMMPGMGAEVNLGGLLKVGALVSVGAILGVMVIKRSGRQRG